jgi:hypothetical protein
MAEAEGKKEKVKDFLVDNAFHQNQRRQKFLLMMPYWLWKKKKKRQERISTWS